MERAFYISDPMNLRFIKSRDYERMYFGQEFCEFLIPTQGQLGAILNFANKQNLKFTFVTPHSNDKAISKLKPLLAMLPQKTEVVFNDWGVFELIRDTRLVPVHGRLLCTIKKDPRIDPKSDFKEYFKTHNIQQPYQQHLLNLGIQRIELDNVKQGYDLVLQPPLRSSLYYPFVQTSVTRKCIFANRAQPQQKAQVVSKCNFECHEQRISTQLDKAPFFVEGKAQYYINNERPVIEVDWACDRTVFMPKFPTTNGFEENIPPSVVL